MKTFDWDKFMDADNDIAVHCKTEEEANDFCKQMDAHGTKWNTGVSYLNTGYDFYENDTCYSNDGERDALGSHLLKNYTILEWSDYMNKEFTKSDLKAGMLVVLRDRRKAELKNCKDGLQLDYEGGGFDRLSWWVDNLLCPGIEVSDIMEVYDLVPFARRSGAFDLKLRDLLYKREEKSPLQLEIEELEQQQREIADRIGKLKEKICQQ